MNRFTLIASAACAAFVLAGTAAAQADKAAAKPAAAASKPAAKPAAKPAKAAKALPAATPEQITAADRALKGSYDCDSNLKLLVANTSNAQGYVDVTAGKSKYTMKPIITSTGALRMEDVGGRMLLLQIANKSMLMDQKEGRRVADNCVHPSQKS